MADPLADGGRPGRLRVRIGGGPGRLRVRLCLRLGPGRGRIAGRGFGGRRRIDRARGGAGIRAALLHRRGGSAPGQRLAQRIETRLRHGRPAEKQPGRRQRRQRAVHSR